MFNLGAWEWIILLLMIVVPLVVVAAGVLLALLIARQTAGMRKCPYCAERIKAEAVICRFCGREVVAQTTAADGPG